jgi:hypothetical protein
MNGTSAPAWRKSSYSGPDGGQCVEVAVTWRKSSYSETSGGQCVEVAASGLVLVRDTKDRAGAVLPLSAAAWRTFIEQTRNATG